MEYCYDDKANGLFTDQKWGDLIPSFFENYLILRDPGYNVASWNLSRRRLEMSEKGDITVNGTPLRFYHFTGYDSGAGQTMTEVYGRNNLIVQEIWQWYRMELEKFGHAKLKKSEWSFGFFENNKPIPTPARILYRNQKDLHTKFSNPFKTGKGGGYYAWYQRNVA
jgi:hypothetical protein